LAVATTIGFHLFFVISITKYLLDFTIPRFDERYFINKLYLMPLALLLILSVYLFYNKKRTDEILESKEEKGEKIFTFKNITTIILVIGVPLFLGIMFIKLGQKV